MTIATICCSTPECEDDAVLSPTFEGRYLFCQPCQDRLALVRAEYEQRNFTNSHRNKAHVNERYCEGRPGCPNRPLYGSDYCPECNGD